MDTFLPGAFVINIEYNPIMTFYITESRESEERDMKGYDQGMDGDLELICKKKVLE